MKPIYERFAKMLEDGKVELPETKELIDALKKDGVSLEERQKGRTFFDMNGRAVQRDAQDAWDGFFKELPPMLVPNGVTGGTGTQGPLPDPTLTPKFADMTYQTADGKLFVRGPSARDVE